MIISLHQSSETSNNSFKTDNCLTLASLISFLNMSLVYFFVYIYFSVISLANANLTMVASSINDVTSETLDEGRFR